MMPTNGNSQIGALFCARGLSFGVSAKLFSTVLKSSQKPIRLALAVSLM